MTTIQIRIKRDRKIQFFVDGKEVARVQEESTDQEKRVSAIEGSNVADFEYTGPKHSRKELKELLGPSFVKEHEEHLKSRMK